MPQHCGSQYMHACPLKSNSPRITLHARPHPRRCVAGIMRGGVRDPSHALSFEELGQLPYLEAALAESMRLLPGAPNGTIRQVAGWGKGGSFGWLCRVLGCVPWMRYTRSLCWGVQAAS